MSQITGSRGYSSSYRGANDPSAFYPVFASDFGASAPAAASVAVHSSGSLATSTATVYVTWITNEGVSLPSPQALASVANGTVGSVTVNQPTVPTNGQTVIGWQIYSIGSGSGGAGKLNTAGTSPAPQSFTTTEGAVTGYPVATTSVVLETYGTGSGVPTIDLSGIQPALPSVPAAAAGNSQTVDYYFIVPNSGSLWKNYKAVHFMRPDSVVDTVGISISDTLDCQSPLYPGATPGSSTYTQESVAPGTYMVMNGNLFVASQTGSQDTASSFIGGSAFSVSKGTTVTDGSVTWYCLGKACLVKARFTNASEATAEIPTAQEYDLFQL